MTATLPACGEEVRKDADITKTIKKVHREGVESSKYLVPTTRNDIQEACAIFISSTRALVCFAIVPKKRSLWYIEFLTLRFSWSSEATCHQIGSQNQLLTKYKKVKAAFLIHTTSIIFVIIEELKMSKSNFFVIPHHCLLITSLITFYGPNTRSTSTKFPLTLQKQ